MVKNYDISFLKDYLKQKGISQSELANNLKMSRQYISLLLNGQQLVNQNHLNIILKLFNVETYDELKELVKNDISDSIEDLNIGIDSKKYDISFLKTYLEKNNISIRKLSDYLNIPYKSLESYLLGISKCDSYLISKLLELFNVKTYNELIILINNPETPNLLDNNLLYSYDISFLKPYLDNNNIKYNEFANIIKINYQVFLCLLSGKRKISCNNPLLYKIYECFDVETYDELLDLINKNIVPDKLKNICKENSMEYLKEYLKINKVSQNVIANIININYIYFNSYLNDRKSIPSEHMTKILEFFNVDNSSELKEYCYLNGRRKYELLNLLITGEILSSNINNELLKQYLYKVPLNINIDLNELLEIVKNYIIDDYMDTIILLFNNDYNYSINEISYITQLNYLEIAKIFRDCVKLYIEKYNSRYKNNYLKVLKKDNMKN